MNVLHITMSTSGGAGVACIRLHQKLISNNISSKVLFLTDKANAASVIPGLFPFKKGFLNTLIIKIKLRIYNWHLKKKLKSQKPGFEIFSSIHSYFNINNHPLYKQADIIHLHWVSGFVNFELFFKKASKPVVWTLHDMFPFTGGCHHSDGCEKFMYDCNNCPQLIGCPDIDFAAKQLAKKKASLKKELSLTIVAPSEWLAILSRKSDLFKKYPHHTIANGINENIFTIAQKNTARQKLNLPADKKIILFVAQSVNNPRKGISLLLDAFSYTKTTDILLLSIGKMQKDIVVTLPSVHLGSINDEEKIAIAYQAADVFILPSVAENQPNTIIESLLCGVPVIAFAVGGIAEMIKNGENGYLSQNINSEALATAIDLFFDSKENFDATDIRKNAIEKYSSRIQAAKYQHLYDDIIKAVNN